MLAIWTYWEHGLSAVFRPSFFSPLSCIPFSCFIVGSFPHIDFSLLPPCSLSSCLLICLSICLGRVWPCPSLPLQEVVSRLIESRLRSLEANTCSEELLFNCTSHTLVLTGLPVRTHEPNTHIHTHRVWSDPKPLPCSCSLSLFLQFHGRGEMNEGRGNCGDEWRALRRSVGPEMGWGRRDGAVISSVCQVRMRCEKTVDMFWPDHS